MTEEQLQFAISQYIDGDLPAEEAIALEKHLAGDPYAQRILKEYQRLNALMAAGLTMPDTDWNSLALKIGKAVEHAAPPGRGSLAGEADLVNRTIWAWRPFAIAASVLICAGLTLIFVHRQTTPAPSENQQLANTQLPPILPDYSPGEHTPPDLAQPTMPGDAAVVHVEVLVADAPQGEAIADIQVGHTEQPNTVAASMIYPMDLTARPTSLSIAAVPRPEQYEDTGELQ